MFGTSPVSLLHFPARHEIPQDYNLEGIYAIWDSERCLYVGWSGLRHRRIQEHRQLLLRGKHNNRRLQQEFDKANPENIYFTALKIVYPKRVVAESEWFWIAALGAICNEDRCRTHMNSAFRKARAESKRREGNDDNQ